MEPVNIYRYSGRGADVMSIQQVWIWCYDIANCQVSVLEEDRSGRPSTTNIFITAIDKMVQADRCVLLKQLLLAFILTWQCFRCCEHPGCHKVCSRWVPAQLSNEHKLNRMITLLLSLQCCKAEGSDFCCSLLLRERLGGTTTVQRCRWNPWYGSIQHCLQSSLRQL
jgi:hypothetical protein